MGPAEKRSNVYTLVVREVQKTSIWYLLDGEFPYLRSGFRCQMPKKKKNKYYPYCQARVPSGNWDSSSLSQISPFQTVPLSYSMHSLYGVHGICLQPVCKAHDYSPATTLDCRPQAEEASPELQIVMLPVMCLSLPGSIFLGLPSVDNVLQYFVMFLLNPLKLQPPGRDKGGCSKRHHAVISPATSVVT